MKMKKKTNSKGFTLIELLAVITIMGILMIVAIPSVSRTIENSRRDTFADVAKSYINTIRSSVLADELECGTANKISVGATPDGVYYYEIDTQAQGTIDLMESGGKSSWSNSDVSGYITWYKKTDTTNGDNKTRTTYAAMLVDTGKHGIENFTLEKNITRSNVSTATKIAYNHSKPISIDKMSQIVGDEGFKVLDGSQPVKCTLK